MNCTDCGVNIEGEPYTGTRCVDCACEYHNKVSLRLLSEAVEDSLWDRDFSGQKFGEVADNLDE